MSAASAASEADVQRRVAVWALQRARLEEEMMRRLESLRFAAPTANDNPKFGADGSKMTHGSPPGVEGDEDDEEGDLMSAYLSPYARANADFAAAEADAAAGEHTVGGGGGVHAGARGALMRARHADVAAFDRHERAALVHALGGMIPSMAVAPEVIDRALRPVADRPFLECIAKLPRPGAHLESRPSSLKVAAPKRKKWRPKSP